MRHRRAVTGIIAAAGLLAAGCGTAKPLPPGTGGAGIPQTPAASAAPSASPSPKAPAIAGGSANIPAASLEAGTLLAKAPVPPGATVLPSPVPVLPISPKLGRLPSAVTRSREWRVPMPLAAATAWVTAHPPAGMTVKAAGRQSGSGTDARTYTYTAPAGPAWGEADLTVQLTGSSQGTTTEKASAAVVYLNTRPLPDRTAGLRTRLAVTGSCPARTAAVGVTNTGADLRTRLLPAGAATAGLECRYAAAPSGRLLADTALTGAQARAVAGRLTALPLSRAQHSIIACPRGDGWDEVIALSYPGRADADVWVSSDGCGDAANGFIVAASAGLATPGAASGCLAGGWAACVRA